MVIHSFLLFQQNEFKALYFSRNFHVKYTTQYPQNKIYNVVCLRANGGIN